MFNSLAKQWYDQASSVPCTVQFESFSKEVVFSDTPADPGLDTVVGILFCVRKGLAVPGVIFY